MIIIFTAVNYNFKCENHTVNKVKELAIGIIVYSSAFFKEINSDGFFHNPEGCQHYFISDWCTWKFYFFTKESMDWFFFNSGSCKQSM